jgi:hypothetical protein
MLKKPSQSSVLWKRKAADESDGRRERGIVATGPRNRRRTCSQVGEDALLADGTIGGELRAALRNRGGVKRSVAREHVRVASR